MTREGLKGGGGVFRDKLTLIEKELKHSNFVI